MATTIGDRIRRYRKRCNYSADTLSTEIKNAHPDSTLSRQVISNIENNRRVELTLSEIIALSEAMGVSPIALVCDVERPFDYCDNQYLQHMKNYEVVFMFAVGSITDGADGVVGDARRIWRALATWSYNKGYLKASESTLAAIVQNGGSTVQVQAVQKQIDEQRSNIAAAAETLAKAGLRKTSELNAFLTAFGQSRSL